MSHLNIEQNGCQFITLQGQILLESLKTGKSDFFFQQLSNEKKTTIKRGRNGDERLTCINKKFIFYKKVSNN